MVGFLVALLGTTGHYWARLGTVAECGWPAGGGNPFGVPTDYSAKVLSRLSQARPGAADPTAFGPPATVPSTVYCRSGLVVAESWGLQVAAEAMLV